MNKLSVLDTRLFPYDRDMTHLLVGWEIKIFKKYCDYSMRN